MLQRRRLLCVTCVIKSTGAPGRIAATLMAVTDVWRGVLTGDPMRARRLFLRGVSEEVIRTVLRHAVRRNHNAAGSWLGMWPPSRLSSPSRAIALPFPLQGALKLIPARRTLKTSIALAIVQRSLLGRITGEVVTAMTCGLIDKVVGLVSGVSNADRVPPILPRRRLSAVRLCKLECYGMNGHASALFNQLTQRFAHDRILVV